MDLTKFLIIFETFSTILGKFFKILYIFQWIWQNFKSFSKLFVKICELLYNFLHFFNDFLKIWKDFIHF